MDSRHILAKNVRFSGDDMIVSLMDGRTDHGSADMVPTNDQICVVTLLF